MIEKGIPVPSEVLRQHLHETVDKIKDPERIRRLYNLAQYLWLNEPAEEFHSRQ